MDLCGNQNFSARSCRIIASAPTPSTRRLLDGVEMPVSHRSTEPGRPCRRREVHPTHWLISTQVWRHLMAGNDAVHELSKNEGIRQRVSGRLLWGARPARRVAFLQGARK